MNDRGTFERAFDWLSSTPGQVLLAGLVGGVLRWLTTEKTWRGGLASIASGIATAWYLGPPTAIWFAERFGAQPDNPQVVGGVSFVVGIGGTSLIALIVSVSRGLNTRGVSHRLKNALLALIGVPALPPAPPTDSQSDDEQGGPTT